MKNPFVIHSIDPSRPDHVLSKSEYYVRQYGLASVLGLMLLVTLVTYPLWAGANSDLETALRDYRSQQAMLDLKTANLQQTMAIRQASIDQLNQEQVSDQQQAVDLGQQVSVLEAKIQIMIQTGKPEVSQADLDQTMGLLQQAVDQKAVTP